MGDGFEDSIYRKTDVSQRMYFSILTLGGEFLDGTLISWTPAVERFAMFVFCFDVLLQMLSVVKFVHA